MVIFTVFPAHLKHTVPACPSAPHPCPALPHTLPLPLTGCTGPRVAGFHEGRGRRDARD
jgi:hypothetical protein